MRQRRTEQRLWCLVLLILTKTLDLPAVEAAEPGDPCTDVPPDDMRTCPEQALLGFCNDPFFIENELCMKTCGRCVSEPPPKPKPKKENRRKPAQPACLTVLETVDSHPMLSILRTALLVGGMEEELAKEDARITLLAPTDDAFLAFFRAHEISERIFLAEVPELVKLLRRHIIPVSPSKRQQQTSGGENLLGDLVRIKPQNDKETVFCLESGTSAESSLPLLKACSSAVYVIDKVLESDDDHNGGFMGKDTASPRKEELPKGPWGRAAQTHLNSIATTRQTSIDPQPGKGSSPCGELWSGWEWVTASGSPWAESGEPDPEFELDLEEELPPAVPMRGGLGERRQASVPSPEPEDGTEDGPLVLWKPKPQVPVPSPSRESLFPPEEGSAPGCDEGQHSQEAHSPSPSPAPSKHDESMSAFRSAFLAGTSAPPPPQIQSQTGHRPSESTDGISALREAFLSGGSSG